MQEQDETRKQRLELMLEVQKEAVVAAALASEISFATHLVHCAMHCFSHTFLESKSSLVCLLAPVDPSQPGKSEMAVLAAKYTQVYSSHPQLPLTHLDV